jgi:hypothetical protein
MNSTPASSSICASAMFSSHVEVQRSGTFVAAMPEDMFAPKMPSLRVLPLPSCARSSAMADVIRWPCANVRPVALRFWRVFLVFAALALYATAVSGPAYNATTPVTLPHHELVRKVYALLAFALLGFALERSTLRRMHGILGAGIAVAVYSYVIELGQIVISQSTETFAEHSFDVASGLAGGALGAFVALLIGAPAARARRIEGAVVAALLAAIAWTFSLTYARLD